MLLKAFILFCMDEVLAFQELWPQFLLMSSSKKEACYWDPLGNRTLFLSTRVLIILFTVASALALFHLGN